ncbi:alpha/beta fold hydrolase [Microbacterium sp. SLBN-146]|uniref:alpha/beta fold hydrolase n=1 Tax=Microbacterium sp. SLBN-146 TaxID=2768457 RepID=UPI0011500252|nr:alpha/beta hydrolase [Microbacterium sp. SLBN-146]TQJ30312.1 pimeloyl-ACP methyl ester carboxylesterase [Microbacterium sp. SLBN-146]
MTEPQPTVVLVHGAFAESASWNGVIAHLQERGMSVVAAANPLRGVASDAAYIRAVISSVDGPVLLVGHSYGGLVITEAASHNHAVVGLVYVAAFVPETGQTAFELSGSAPGSTLGDALAAYPLADGGTEFAIRAELFPHQFAADVPAAEAALMSATQRPITQAALTEPLPTDRPAWKDIPSWHVFGDQDLNIPVAVHRAGAERAAARATREVTGASHAISVSQPRAVAEIIVEAAGAVRATSEDS